MKIDLESSSSYVGGHPVEQYAWLREHDPVHWHPETVGAGFWALTRHADLQAVSRDTRLFTSTENTTLFDLDEQTLAAGRKMMLLMDPPEHTAYRRLVRIWFTAKASNSMVAKSREIATLLVDDVIERGACDFVGELVGLMPLYFIADLLGFPREDGPVLYERMAEVHGAPDAVTDEQRFAASTAIFDYALGVARRKQEQPADDLTTMLLSAEVDGNRLSEEQFVTFFWLLLNAGADTVRNGLGGGLLALLDHPEQWRALRRADEATLATAVEEIIRWTSPVAHMRRTATADTELHGRPIARGDKVVMFYGAANRDESVFADAGAFRADRNPNPHIAFGAGGPHLCLGLHLARVEMAAMLREITNRMTDIEVAGEPTWHASNYIIGPAAIPVRFPTDAPVLAGTR